MLTRPPGKGIPGQEILAELPPEPGVLLWKSFRNAELWSRGGGRKLFSEGAFELREELLRSTPGVEELKRPLGVIAGALKNRPGLEPAELSGACGQISAWAEERAKLRTALCFMQAASRRDALRRTARPAGASSVQLAEKLVATLQGARAAGPAT